MCIHGNLQANQKPGQGPRSLPPPSLRYASPSSNLCTQSPPPHTQRHAGSPTQMLTDQLQLRRQRCLVTPEAPKTRDFNHVNFSQTPKKKALRVHFALMAVHVKPMKPFNHDFLGELILKNASKVAGVTRQNCIVRHENLRQRRRLWRCGKILLHFCLRLKGDVLKAGWRWRMLVGGGSLPGQPAFPACEAAAAVRDEGAETKPSMRKCGRGYD